MENVVCTDVAERETKSGAGRFQHHGNFIWDFDGRILEATTNFFAW